MDSKAPQLNPDMAFQAPAMDNLLDPLSESHEFSDAQKSAPSLTLRFSIIKLLRFTTVVISTTALGFIAAQDGHKGLAALFGTCAAITSCWSAIQLVRSIGIRTRKLNFSFTVGDFVCTYGNRRADPFATPSATPPKKSYVVNLVDLAFCALMIIPSVVSLKTDIWGWSHKDRIGGLCIAVASLQLALAVLGPFSLCHKAKVCVYSAENEKAAYVIEELYRDEEGRRTGSYYRRTGSFSRRNSTTSV
ncbi:hypothetical protein G7046_g5680 [Stylonectria norvegica]|nr:hypothetical protein G7046_g5680 [Stylonectria norvegica]